MHEGNHLFGFTFRVMWPLLTGRAFSDLQIKFPGEVSRATRHYERIVLISSPAFLSRACHLMDFAVLAKSYLLAFSSGGPLGTETAVHFNRNSGISLVELEQPRGMDALQRARLEISIAADCTT